MDAKLRAFLKREGITDEVLDKLERGEVPDDDSALHKQADDNPFADQLRKVDAILQEIQERLDRIEKCDRHRAAFQKFTTGMPINGAAHAIDLKGHSP
jgi:hypothetical protein